jgi:hypothetical protein
MSADCLVLKIVEKDSLGRIDATIYVLYDVRLKRYYLWGSRASTPCCDLTTYSFVCKKTKDLANFISYVMCQYNTFSYTLFNHSGLPYSLKYTTLECIEEYDYRENEISGYDDCEYNKKYLVQTLGMLKNVFNYY